MKNKGQISFFIIVGVLIVLLVGGFLLFRSDLFQKQAVSEKEEIIAKEDVLNTVNGIADSCLQHVAEKALVTIGERGGVYESENFFDYLLFKVNYGYYNEHVVFPSDEQVIRDLKLYLILNLQNCIQNSAESAGVQKYVQYSLSSSEISLTEENVQFVVDPGIKIKAKDYSGEIGEKSFLIDLKLAEILGLSRAIIQRIDLEDIVPSTSLLFTDYHIILDYPSDGTIIYTIHDNRTFIQGDQYSFSFAVDVSTPDPDNYAPIIEEIPSKTVNVGNEFSYRVVATDPDGDSLEYIAITTLFDITQDGMISFTADETMIGEHSIVIIVTDPDGLSDSKYLDIEII